MIGCRNVSRSGANKASAVSPSRGKSELGILMFNVASQFELPR